MLRGGVVFSVKLDLDYSISNPKAVRKVNLYCTADVAFDVRLASGHACACALLYVISTASTHSMQECRQGFNARGLCVDNQNSARSVLHLVACSSLVQLCF